MFDRNERIAGYELSLDLQMQSRFKNRSAAIRKVYDDALLRELAASRVGSLLADQVAIVEVALESVVNGLPRELPRANSVLIIDPMEESLPDESMVRASIDALAGAGLRVGWKLRSAPESVMPILARCQLVQVVASAFDGIQLKELARKLRRVNSPNGSAPVLLIARDVQTPDDYQLCLRAGFDYFQGPFVTSRLNWNPPKSDVDRIRVFQILNQLRSGADNGALAKALRMEPVLTFKLLRYVNSAAMGLQQRIGTIEQALIVIGSQKLSRWLSLLVFDIKDRGFAERALIERVLVRARMMESLGAGTVEPDLAFLTGLLSLLDQLLGRPIGDVLSQITLPPDVMDALLAQTGPYAPLLELAKVCEHGDQALMAAAASRCGLAEDAVNAQLIAALGWAHKVAAITE
ncbi:MAG: EAL and HDOD domain-containing protein [Burkholderiales bacterium]